MTITVPCAKSTDSVVIDGGNISDMTYYVASDTEKLQQFQFSVTSGTFCDQDNIIYSIAVTPSAAFITLDVTNK